MFTFVSSGSLRFAGRFAQRAFYSLASPGRAMNAERIPPSSQPCRGRRQNTHKARLVNYSWRDRPHLHPESLHPSPPPPPRFQNLAERKREKKTDAGHRMVIACDRLSLRCEGISSSWFNGGNRRAMKNVFFVAMILGLLDG